MKKQEHSHPMCNNVLQGILHHTGIGIYYYCNRSRVSRKRSTGARHTKSQGSRERCTAHIKATEDLTSGEGKITYCKTHHNHDINLGHMRLQCDSRMKIAA